MPEQVGDRVNIIEDPPVDTCFIMQNGVRKEKFEKPQIQLERLEWSMESLKGVADARGDDKVVISNEIISHWIREREAYD